ncbi:MAG: hypothetical protein KBB83_01660 [Alphaproteobacteria bacterium]|nr:hypothetical protein [Alphaproteobacteria bacterium]
MKQNLWTLSLFYLCWFGIVHASEHSRLEQDVRYSYFQGDGILPAEMVVRISSYLPEIDYKAFADTCQQLHGTLLDQELISYRLNSLADAHLADERLQLMAAKFNALWGPETTMAQRIAETQEFEAEFLEDVRSLWGTIYLHFKWLRFHSCPDETLYICRSEYYDADEAKTKRGYVYLNLPFLHKLDKSISQYQSLRLLFYIHALGRCENLAPSEPANAFLEVIRKVLDSFNAYKVDLCYSDGWMNRARMFIIYVMPRMHILRDSFSANEEE